MVDSTGLENQRTATFRGFESLLLRGKQVMMLVFRRNSMPLHRPVKGIAEESLASHTISNAYLAQLVERILGMDEVTGSIPVLGSTVV